MATEESDIDPRALELAAILEAKRDLWLCVDGTDVSINLDLLGIIAFYETAELLFPKPVCGCGEECHCDNAETRPEATPDVPLIES